MSIFTKRPRPLTANDETEMMLSKPLVHQSNVVLHASGSGMLTCICMQNLYKISHVVLEL